MDAEPAAERPALARSFRGRGGALWGAVLSGGGLCLIGLGLVVVALFAGPGLRGGGKVLFVAISLAAVGLGAFVLHGSLAVVSLTDRGVRIAGLFGSKVVRWEKIVCVLVGTISDAQRRRARVGGAFGVVGALAAAALSDDARTRGDPVTDPGARDGLSPCGSLRGADDRVLATLPSTLGWDFYDALRGEAEARSIEVRSDEAGRGRKPRTAGRRPPATGRAPAPIRSTRRGDRRV